MFREEPFDPPTAERVGAAVGARLDRVITAVDPIEEGLNAVYRIRFRDGDRAVLKLATLSTDAVLVAESRVLGVLADAAVLPTPEPLATVGADDSSLGGAWFLMTHCAGEPLTDLLALPADSREALVREAGSHLAALHGLDIESETEAASESYGALRVLRGDPEAPLTVVATDTADEPRGSGEQCWPHRFATLAEMTVDALGGDGGYTSDADRPDLAATVDDALAVVGLPDTPDPALLHLDYRPANLLFAPSVLCGDTERAVSAVLDFGGVEVGDGLLDLAFAEDALAGVPLGGTREGDRLAAVLRDAYATARTDSPTFDGDRYTAYLLLARATRLSSAGYFWQFAREDEQTAAEARWERQIRDLALDLGAT